MANKDDIPSVKDLASSDPALRRRALSTITTHLRARTTPITRTQALQLQKGFFFALYMHDSKSPLSVQNLIVLLADLTVFTPSLSGADTIAIPLMEAFWATMAREWTGVDALRMDKYLLWVRMVMRAMLGRAFDSAARDSEREFLEEQVALLEKFPLSPRERQVPDGLRYHVLDVYVDEMEKAIGQREGGDEDKDEVSDEAKKVVHRLLVPVETIAKEGLSKGVRLRAKEVLGDDRVIRWRRTETAGEGGGGGGGGAEADGEDEWGGLD